MRTHAIELHRLQAEALRDGATVLLLPVEDGDAKYLRELDVRPEWPAYDTDEEGTEWYWHGKLKNGEPDICSREQPYNVGDVLELQDRVPMLAPGEKIDISDPRAYGRIGRVTVRDIKPVRPQDVQPERSTIGAWVKRSMLLGQSMGCPDGAEAWFDAIHGEGAYEANAWYWRVEVEA